MRVLAHTEGRRDVQGFSLSGFLQALPRCGAQGGGERGGFKAIGSQTSYDGVSSLFQY